MREKNGPKVFKKNLGIILKDHYHLFPSTSQYNFASTCLPGEPGKTTLRLSSLRDILLLKRSVAEKQLDAQSCWKQGEAVSTETHQLPAYHWPGFLPFPCWVDLCQEQRRATRTFSLRFYLVPIFRLSNSKRGKKVKKYENNINKSKQWKSGCGHIARLQG